MLAKAPKIGAVAVAGGTADCVERGVFPIAREDRSASADGDCFERGVFPKAREDKSASTAPLGAAAESAAAVDPNAKREGVAAGGTTAAGGGFS